MADKPRKRRAPTGNLAKLAKANVVDVSFLTPAHKKVIAGLSDEEVKMLIDLKRKLGGGPAWTPFSTKFGWVCAL